MPLYKQTGTPYQAAMEGIRGAAGTAAGMTKETRTERKEPEKTFGGGIKSGLGGMVAGLSVAESLNSGTTSALFGSIGKSLGLGGAEAAKTGINMGTNAAIQTLGQPMLTTGTGAVAGSGAGALAGTGAGAMTGAGAGTVAASIPAAMEGMAPLMTAKATLDATALELGLATGTETLTAGTGLGADVLTSTTTGTAAAGPIGAIVGGVVGLAGGLLSYFL